MPQPSKPFTLWVGPLRIVDAARAERVHGMDSDEYRVDVGRILLATVLVHHEHAVSPPGENAEDRRVASGPRFG